MFSNAVKIFDVFGFQIRVDPTWLVIAALIVWSLATGYFPQEVPGLHCTDYLAVAVAVAAMFGLFASLILHELAHSLVARRFGLGVGGITLFLFGGVAELEQEPQDAASEFWIAVAGPAMSLALAALFKGLAAATASASPVLVAVIDYLATINLVLAVFNLLPAFPLDGGRVLRAALWRAGGDLLAATRTASVAGSLFGYLLVAIGFAALFSGQTVIGGLWPILIGLFLAAAARATYRQMLTRRALRGRTVGDLMTREVHTTGPERTVRQLVDDVMLTHGVGFVPVIENGQALGYVDTGTVRAIDRENWDALRVEDVFVPLVPDMTTHPGEPLDRLLDRIGTSSRRKFIVEDGRRFAGVITLSDLFAHIAVLRDLSPGGVPPSLQRSV